MIKGLIRLFLRFLIFSSLTSIIAVLGFSVWFYDYRTQPGIVSEDRLFFVPPGMNHGQLQRALAKEGYVRAHWHYPIMRLSYSLIDDASFQPKAGEFFIPAKASLVDVFKIIDEGSPYQHRFTVVEGMLSKDVVAAIKEDDRLTGGIGSFPKEGSLAPETYFFVRGEKRADLIARMQKRQEILLAQEWAERQTGLPYETASEALIMASIIEKEAVITGEQALISSVFINRIRKKMRLQSDATVLYGVVQNEGSIRRLLKSDLKKDGPYNSYTRAGLPPAPIGNPGHKAIIAALNPIPSPYFYFVADGQGGHKFATNLDDHNRNVQSYRKWRASQAKKESQ